jgi:hypothetical protein
MGTPPGQTGGVYRIWSLRLRSRPTFPKCRNDDIPLSLSRARGLIDVERPDQLIALARRCRELAAGLTDEETRKSLELLARDYEARAAETEAGPHRPEMPKPE